MGKRVRRGEHFRNHTAQAGAGAELTQMSPRLDLLHQTRLPLNTRVRPPGTGAHMTGHVCECGSAVYAVPVASVTKCPKPSGLEQHKAVLLQLCRPESEITHWAPFNTSRRQGWILLQAPEESLPHLLQLPEAACIPWLVGPDHAAF